MDQNQVIDSDLKCPWIKQNLEKVETTLPQINKISTPDICEDCPNKPVSMSWYRLKLDGVTHLING